jgi:hypothetical protein
MPNCNSASSATDSSFVVSADDCEFGSAMGSCTVFGLNVNDDDDDVNDDNVNNDDVNDDNVNNDNVNDNDNGGAFLFRHLDGFSQDVVVTSADEQETRHVDGQPSVSFGLHDVINTSADEQQDTWQDEGHGDDIRGDEHPTMSFETDPADQPHASGPPAPADQHHMFESTADQSPPAGGEGSQAQAPPARGDESLSSQSQPQPPALAPSDLPRVTSKVCQLVSGIVACSPCAHARIDVHLLHHTLLNVE